MQTGVIQRGKTFAVNIAARGVCRAVRSVRAEREHGSLRKTGDALRRGKRKLSERERDEEIRKLEKQMQEASRMLEFEYAAVLRDRIIELRKEQK